MRAFQSLSREEETSFLLSRFRAFRLASKQFIGQRVRSVDLAQGLLNASGIHGNRASLHVTEGKVPGQRFDVSVENDSHHFAFLIHRGRSRVASNNVGGGNKVQRGLRSEERRVGKECRSR